MTDTNTEQDFSTLPLNEKIDIVDKRLGNQAKRISDPRELLELRGETMHLIISPFGNDQNIGTCFLLDWIVGEVKDHRGNVVTEDSEITLDNDEKYVCYHHEDKDSVLSLRDFNIIPNSYNNGAAFTTKDAAEAYAVYRKMMYAEDSAIAELEGGYPHFFKKDDIKKLLKEEKSK